MTRDKQDVARDEKRCEGIRKTVAKMTQYQRDRLYYSLMHRPEDEELERTKAKKIKSRKEKDDEE